MNSEEGSRFDSEDESDSLIHGIRDLTRDTWLHKEILWDYARDEELNRQTERLREIFIGHAESATIAQNYHEATETKQRLSDERDAERYTLRITRGFWIAIVAAIAFLAIPRIMLEPTCEEGGFTSIFSLVGIVLLIALSPLFQVMWNIIVGRIKGANEVAVRFGRSFQRQYMQTPTLTLALWALIIWTVYCGLFRYGYTSDYVSGNDEITVITTYDRLTGESHVGRFTSDQCYAEHQQGESN